MVMQIRRTRAPDNPPVDLLPGQLAVEMAHQPSPRLWIGVPVEIDPTRRREFVGGGSGGDDAFTTGDVKLTFQTVAEPGWIIAVDGSIGNGLSGATTRADDDTLDLFTMFHEYIPSSGDAFFSYVVAQLGNEQRAAGGTGFIDQSQRGHAVVPDLSPTWVTAPTPTPPGTLDTAINFPAAGGRFYIPNSPDWRFGTEDFCFEAYVRPSGGTQSFQALFMDGAAQAFRIYTSGNNTAFHADFAGWGAGWQPPPAPGVPFGTVTQNQWQHIAVYRIGSNFYGAKDGVPVLLLTNPGALYATTGHLYVGTLAGFNQFVGQMAGIRITKGASRYGADNFTPPPLPLFSPSSGDALFDAVIVQLGNEQGPVGNDTTFVDQSPRGHTVRLDSGTPMPQWLTPPAALPHGALDTVLDFRAAGNRLYLFERGDWQFGADDFCLEGYVRPTATHAHQLIFASGGSTFAVYSYATNQWVARFSWGTGFQFDGISFGAVSFNEWQHIAVYRIGSNWYGAKDGVPVFLGTATNALNVVAGHLWVGWFTGYNYFVGQMAGLRITRGAARYPATLFTPPALPLMYPTAVPGGVELELQNSSGATVNRGASAIDDFAANRRLVIPKMLGRALAGAGVGAGLLARELGSTAGADTQAQTAEQVGIHSHPFNARLYTYAEACLAACNSWGVNVLQANNPNTGGGALPKVQPTTFLNSMIKL
jgi:hypothetical protein